MEYKADNLYQLTLFTQEHDLEEDYKWLISNMEGAAKTGRFGVVVKQNDVSYDCLLWLKAMGYLIYGLQERENNNTIKVPLTTNEALSTTIFPKILISWRKENT